MKDRNLHDVVEHVFISSVEVLKLQNLIKGAKEFFFSSHYAVDCCLYSVTGVQRKKLPLIISVL